ncbi:MAG: hypothetical protein IJR54_01910 [Oscillibacter sp.]|nr:hypothetical protein [Oscillibacter sp.]
MRSANRERTYRFPALNGGLNLRDAEINLKDNESPEIVNLWWEDGVLQARPGQERATSGWGGGSYSGYAFPASDAVYAATTFQEGVVVHVGASLYTWHGNFRELRRVTSPGNASIATGVPRNAGTFFRFGNDLFYKNAGGFYRLTYNASHGPLTAPLTISRVADNAFIPTVLVNADPATGQGDPYQSENRLSPQKRVRYVALSVPENVVRTGNGLTRVFSMGVTASENLRGVSAVYVDTALLKPALYSVDVRSGSVLFNTAPAENSVLTFTLDIGQLEYHLPADSVEAVTQVRVDGLTMVQSRDYAADPVTGTVTFTQAPPAAASVEITYRQQNAAALAEIMACPYALACGTGERLCIVTGGAEQCPEAVYWSGVTESGPDPSYWPEESRNLIGGDVTGFGGQYDQIIVFQSRRIGKLSLSNKTLNGRDSISLTYSGVHDKIGCDLPRSVQLIGNNLTFANTSGGVYQVLSSSAARENNVRCLSGKINGSDTRPGLLHDMRVAGTGPVCSLDDGQRYWLAVNDHVWLWDYSLSDSADPVWFFFTGLSPRALSMRDRAPCLVNAAAQTVRLGPVLSDFGEAVRKVYQFPVRNFGGYDRLKDVRAVLFSLRADTPSDVAVLYETDYETRADLLSLHVAGYDRLTDRNLEVRDLSVPRHAAVFRRRPKCRHVRHFSLRLENNAAGQNLAPYSVEIQIRYQGRDR